VNHFYEQDYSKLMDSGLYDKLVDENLLIPHEEVNTTPPQPDKSFKIIQPKELDFISYPYEWSFSQLKRAALTTLKIQKTALDFDMTLKDASAYNIQYEGYKPIFIDTLSFEEYTEGEPWVAYRQFCQHFLAPLALMSYRDVKLNQLLRVHLDGVPLNLASSLLPMRSRLKFTLLSHIHFHARSQERYVKKSKEQSKVSVDTSKKMGRTSLLGLIDSLESAVDGLSWREEDTLWSDYYGGSSNYSNEAMEDKKRVVEKFLNEAEPEEVWDLGANIGVFSRIASNKGIRTISFDFDPACVEGNYRKNLEEEEENILPLLLDLTNPSPGIGWENQERKSLLDRGPTDTALALALVHHLAISNNTPFRKIAHFFSKLCNSLIVEFVPKDDSQVQMLLANRKDIFSDYTKNNFEAAFEEYFPIADSKEISDSKRTIYLMERNE
ncbi:MAG: SAM-dependent methyltransferase, partial [Candidatus Hadarchaeia archaeon]